MKLFLKNTQFFCKKKLYVNLFAVFNRQRNSIADFPIFGKNELFIGASALFPVDNRVENVYNF